MQVRDHKRKRDKKEKQIWKNNHTEAERQIDRQMEEAQLQCDVDDDVSTR